MKRIINFYRDLAINWYPYRWLLVALFFLPFGVSMISENITLLVICALVWAASIFLLFVVLAYGPISHFKGSVIWEESQEWMWVLLTLFALMPVIGLISLVIQYVFAN